MIYEKPRAELFAQDAPDSEIKPFTAWLRGLGIAFDETGGLPEMESFNGLLQALNGYIKYLEQNGFAEWSDVEEYPVGAGVRVGATWYRAKTRNTNKPPSTSQNDWSLFLNASDLSFGDPIQLVSGVVSIKDASQTQKGVVQFANSSEVSSRANISKAVNPANIAQMFSRTQQQMIFPDGTIIKYGTSNDISDGSSINVSFPEPFPGACYNVQLTENRMSTVNAHAAHVSVGNLTRQGFTLSYNSTSSTSTSVYWLAIGY